MTDWTITAAGIGAIAVLAGALIAAYTSLFGVLLGAVPTYLVARSQHRMEFERLYSEKWWDKKAEAYSHVLESLSYMQYYYDSAFNIEVAQKSHSQEAYERFKSAREVIVRAAAAEAYVITEDATATLRELIRNLNAVQGEEYLGILQAISDC